MVHRCVLCRTNIRQAESKGLSYHCFPINNPLREKWIQAIAPHVEKPEQFKIVQNYTRICSRHFKNTEYSYDAKKRARLNSSAVPSVFQRKSTTTTTTTITATTTTNPFVQSTIEAIKPRIAKLKNAAMTLANSPILAPTPTSHHSHPQNGIKDQTIEKLFVVSAVDRNKDKIIKEAAQNQDEEEEDDDDKSTGLVQSATSASDQMILNLLDSVVSPEPSQVENVDSDKESLDNKQEQQALQLQQQQQQPEKGSSGTGVRKRRKWNRTAFTRSTKSKLKKDTINGVVDSNSEDSGLGDSTVSSFFPLLTPTTPTITTTTNNNSNSNNSNNNNNDSISLQKLSNELQIKNDHRDINVPFKTPSTPINTNHHSSSRCSSSSRRRISTVTTATSSEITSSSSSSCLSLNDQIAVNLSLMSLDQDLLQSIQAVSLDCVESDDITKNIHIGETDLVPIEDLVSDLLLDSSTHKSESIDGLENNPILLEDALISSASGTNLHSPEAQDDDLNKLIDNLAYNFSSSLLTTNGSLPPDSTDLNKLRLYCPTFCNPNSINLDLPDNLLISTADILPKEEDCTMSGNSQTKEEPPKCTKISERYTNKKAAFPKKKLVGISKTTRVRDRSFGIFSVDRFRDSDRDIEYYTGFPTYQHFEKFFYSLETYVGKLKVTDIMHGIEDVIKIRQELQQQQQEKQQHLSTTPIPGEESKTTASNEYLQQESLDEQKSKKPYNRKKIDEVFLTLVRLKRKIPEKVLGDMFLVSQPTVSRVVRAWTCCLSKLLEPIPLLPCSNETSPNNNLNNGGSSSVRTKIHHHSGSTKKEESNYFSIQGIYIPDPVKMLFKSDLAINIISSTTSIKKTNRNNNNNNNNDDTSDSMEIVKKYC